MPKNPRTFHTKFIFSLKAILPDLEPAVENEQKVLAGIGVTVDDEMLVYAWVTYQLERYLHLHIDSFGQKRDLAPIVGLLSLRFFQQNTIARDLLLSQVRPLLTHRETIPYTDRICRVEVRQPDLQLQFL